MTGLTALAEERGVSVEDVATVAEWITPGDDPITDEIDDDAADDVRLILGGRQRWPVR